MKPLFYLLFLFLVLTSPSAFAQIAENLFMDTTEFPGGRGVKQIRYQDKYIIGGVIGNATAGLICIDSVGNRLWSIINATGGFSEFFLGTDEFVYASYLDNSNLITRKIDPQNGRLIWKKSFAAYSVRNIFDYDSSRFIIPYLQSYNGSTYHTRFAMVSKATGDTLSTYFIANIPWSIEGSAMAVDSGKNIYYTIGDSIVKVSGANPATSIWRQKYASSSIETIRFLEYNETNNALYALGTRSSSFHNGFLAKVDASGGTLLKYFITSSAADIRPNYVKVKDNYLYASWQHIYVGSVTSYHHITKYDFATDTILWNLRSHFTSSGSGQESVINFDIGDSGFVYATGYAKSADYGPGIWTNIKVHPTTGLIVDTATISNNVSSFNETQSSGFGVVSFASKLVVFGNIEEKGGGRPKLNLTFLDPTNLNILAQRDFGNYIHPSRTVQIKKHPNGNAVVLKQLGGGLELEMYDVSGSLLWKNSYRASFLEGYQLDIAPLGEIYFTAVVRQATTSHPYKSTVADSICLYQCDEFGNLKGVLKRASNLVKAAPIELIAGDSFAILLFHENDTVYAIKSSNGSQLGLENTGMIYKIQNESEWNATFNKNNAELFLFGRRDGTPRIFKLNKQSFVWIDTLALPSFSYIEHTNAIDSAKVVLVGKTPTSASLYGVFNTTTMSMAWVTTASTTFNAYKTLIDPSRTYLFVVGKTTTNDIRIQKHLLSSGALIASYTYTTTGWMYETPLDISYNEYRRKILVVGSVVDNGITKVMMLNIDTALSTNVKTYVRTNAGGVDRATCVEQISNEKILAGGYVTSGLQCGAVFEIPDTFFCKSTYRNDTITACGSYLWAGRYLTQSGNYDTTLPRRYGCDSIMHLSLTVKPAHSDTQTIAACGPIMWNGNLYSVSGTYRINFMNTFGCDSSKTLILSINKNSSNHNVVECDSLYWINRYLKAPGVYRDTLMNRFGCDSIVTLVLAINYSTVISQAVTGCNSVVWRGKTFSRSGIYIDSLVSSKGCDSLFTLRLTIDSLNMSIIRNGDSLISDQMGGTYQWINCSTGLAVSGAQLRSFKPNISGQYSLLVSNGYCSDTTDCVEFFLTGIEHFYRESTYSLTPNPFSESAVLMVPFSYREGYVRIVNALGETVRFFTVDGQANITIEREQLPTGMYFFLATFDEKQLEGKLIIRD